MTKVNNREVREQCARMNDAWTEGAPTVTFNGITQTAFAADIAAAAAADAEVGDLEAQLNMKRDERDTKYAALNEKRSKVGLGVAGNPDLGNDSPLFGAMGFVRKSERASGLTRKSRKPPTK
ncbi:MAG: hypothetical protein M3209_15520 [Acidobacteriota bacterium]|nr:hypothetical protein [Acidobacteriota bacterium]